MTTLDDLKQSADRFIASRFTQGVLSKTAETHLRDGLVSFLAFGVSVFGEDYVRENQDGVALVLMDGYATAAVGVINSARLVTQ
jgi:hypothetical protein